MAVTDLTDSLPYWARQGGPGATGGPTGAPQGGPGSPAWLQYLSQYFGISPAQAATLAQNGGPSPDDIAALKAGGSAVPSALSGGGPPVPAMTALTQPPAGPPVGAGMLDQSGVQRGPMGVLRTQPGASAPVGAGLPDQSGVTRSPAGVLTPGTGPAAPVAAPAPVAGPLAGGGAAGTAATSNPRFIGIDAPNATAQNSMLSRGVPQGTALNLAGLFGGGQGAANMGAGGGPAPYGYLDQSLGNTDARGAPYPAGKVPGPLASAPRPPTMPDDIRRQRAIQLAAARSGFA